MSGFKNITFPSCVSFGASGGPGFLTNVVPMNSGKESRDQVWQLQRGTWEVSHAAKKPEEYIPLRAFFFVVRGRAYSFRFSDHTDYTVSASEGKFVMITATTFQMIKRYSFGAETYDRYITKPISTVTVTGGTVASINYATGVVTMTSGTPLTWSGTFDCHCRFDTDQMRQEIVNKSPDGELFITWASIPIVEVKE